MTIEEHSKLFDETREQVDRIIKQSLEYADKQSAAIEKAIKENTELSRQLAIKEGEIAGLKTKLEFREAECIKLADKITEYEKKLMAAYQKIDKLEHDYINEILKRKSEPIKSVFKVH